MTNRGYWLIVASTAVVICAAFAGVRSFLPPSSKMQVIVWEWPDSYAVISTRKDGTKEIEILGPFSDKKPAR